MARKSRLHSHEKKCLFCQKWYLYPALEATPEVPMYLKDAPQKEIHWLCHDHAQDYNTEARMVALEEFKKHFHATKIHLTDDVTQIEKALRNAPYQVKQCMIREMKVFALRKFEGLKED